MSSSTPSLQLLPESAHFNGKNLSTWKVQEEELIGGKGLWGYIDGSIQRPITAPVTLGPPPPPTTALVLPTPQPAPTPVYSSNPSRDEWDFRNRLARSMVVLNVADPIGLGVNNTGTAKEAWDSIINEYGKKTEMRLSEAKRALGNRKYIEGEDIEEFVKDMRTKRKAVDDLSDVGKSMEDTEFRGTLIRAMPLTSNWLPMIPSLYACMSSSDIIVLLQTHAFTLYGDKKPSDSSLALATGTFGRSCTNPQCKAVNKSSHTVDNCYWPGGGKEGQFPANFGKRGRPNRANSTNSTNNTPNTTTPPQANTAASHVQHFVLAARAFKRDSNTVQAVVIEDIPEDGGGYISAQDNGYEYTCDVPNSARAYVTSTFSEYKPHTTLNFLDSGASDHFMKSREDFTDYTPVAYRTGSSAVQGKGTFAINGTGTAVKHFRVMGKLVKITFKNALHAPSLAANLISVSALDAAGLFTTFGGGRAVIHKGDGQEIFSGRGTDGMYVLDPEFGPSSSRPSGPTAMSSRSSPAPLHQWHRRFVHASPEMITAMEKADLVDGLKGAITDYNIEGKCEDCILARQTRRPFDVPTNPNVRPLELVAIDLWGPSRTQSVGGKVYMMNIVDSGTSFKHAVFLGDKSDDTTLKAFEEYRVMAENQTGQKIKALRADGAFAGSKWEEYCKLHGIRLELTAPHSSAQNGIAERSIRTTIEDTRALLRDSGLPHKYWAEAAAMSIYTRNLIPSKRHPNSIPGESFTGKRQDVSHLRAFGSVCWAKIPTVNGAQVDGGSKLDDRSVKCTFLGYASGANYKLIDAASGRVFTSRDVIFEEGRPRRTLSSVGEEDDLSLFPLDDEPSILPTADPDPDPVQQPTHEEPTPEPRRSTRTVIPGPAAVGSREYLEGEESARRKRDEWATNSRRPRAAMAQLSVELDDYIACMAETKSSHNIPRSYHEAMRVDPVRWTEATDTEYEMHMKKHTWDLVEKPPGANVMDCMWVFDIKWNGEGVGIRDKARLVGKGYTQQLGLDYNETWAAVTRLESVRMSVAIAAKLGLHLWQVDFVSAYLNSETKEDIYMRQPPGYVVHGHEDEVCKLVHTIYGTMQGGHDWFETLGDGYDELDYYTSRADPCVRTKQSDDGSYTLTDTYTDDVWGASSSREEAEHRMKELGELWEIRDVGENKYFLGMKIDQDVEKGTIRLSQRPYFENIIERFNLDHIPLRSTPLPVGIALDNDMSPTNEAEQREMEDKPYRRVLGSVMWAQIATRPDLSFAVSLLARFQSNPGPAHWQALMHVIGYIRSTLDFGITYSKGESIQPAGYVDADYGGCRDTKRSTSGYIFMMAGGPVSWSSKRQATVALSTVEAEYVSLTRAAQQMKWMYSWMEEVGLPQEKPGILKGDNRGAVALTKNTRNHAKVKHIDIREHYIRELVHAGDLSVEFIRGNANPADLFTKPLPRDAHYRYLSELHISAK